MSVTSVYSHGVLRIGEFARRVDVNPELLRAWERRYGLLQPVRSSGGFRLYTDEDAERVARMRLGLEEGLSAAEAARAAVESDRPAEGLMEDSAERLRAAIAAYDEAALHTVIDEALAAFGLEAVLSDLLLPALRQVGVDWEDGKLEVSQEHFASNVIRGRLLGLARLWGRGGGPLALLACAPGEAHDISLLMFGLVLRSHGWRILFLGANTPTDTLQTAAGSARPELTVVTSFEPELLEAEVAALRRIGKATSLAICGPGASEAIGRRIGARVLDADPVAAATEVARG